MNSNKKEKVVYLLTKRIRFAIDNTPEIIPFLIMQIDPTMNERISSPISERKLSILFFDLGGPSSFTMKKQ